MSLGNVRADIAVVILAAGNSSRFGTSKMEHKLSTGKSILSTTIELYQSVFQNISVVVPQNSALIKMVTDLNSTPVVIDDRTQGMSQSLIAGINSEPNVSAWLIALGDMPYIKDQTLRLLAQQFVTGSIVAPLMKQRQGNPVIFDQRFKASLLSLKGDVGAKKILVDNHESIINVLVNDSGVLHDIDQPQDILPG